MRRLGWLLVMGAPLLLMVLLAAQRSSGSGHPPILTLLALLVVGGIGVLGILSALKPTGRSFLSRKKCPECGYDLRASTGRCPECGTAFMRGPRDYTVPLRDDMPATPVAARRPDATEQKVRVLIGWGGLADDLLLEHLRRRGIECFVNERKAPGVWRYRPAPWVKEVWVWSGDEERATQIINRMVDADGTPARHPRPRS